MNIVQIGAYPLSPDCIHGGIESSVYGLTQHLAENHTIDVFDFPRIGGKDCVEQFGSITIHRYCNRGKHNKDAVSCINSYLRDIIALHPDLCHIHGTGTFSKAIYMALWDYGLPMMLTVHGLLREEKWQAVVRKPSLKHIYQYIVQKSDEKDVLNVAPVAIVDTDYVQERLLRYKLARTPQLHVIPQGIDSSFFEIKCNPQSNVILSVGSIGPRKGHIYTVKMFNVLRTRGVDAKLQIIGSLADEKYYSLLQREIKISPFCSDITLNVNLEREELMLAYSSAKLFVLHSREESQGIVFAEAMAIGLPIVATNVGGIPYVVDNGECGLLCNYSDVKSMADMSEKLLTNYDLWCAFSDNARKKASQYNWEGIAKEIESLYSKIAQ